MSAALADPAVRCHLFFRRDAFGLVEFAEFVCALEGPVVADGRRPGNRRRGRDVAGALRALLLVAGRGDQVAGVLLRAADVDERLRLLADLRSDRVPVRPDRLIALVGPVVGLLRLRGLGRELTCLIRPLLAASRMRTSPCP